MKIQAVEIVVEMDDGARAVERIERPDVRTFDRETLPNGTRRVRFDVTGRTTEIGAHFGAHPR